MHRKLLMAVIGFLALMVVIGVPFMPVSPAASGHVFSMSRTKPSGLTLQGIENARKAGMRSELVKMAPQSSVKLLAQARKLGPHAPKSTIELTIGLKLRHVAGLKSFLQQLQNPHSAVYHQWVTPEQFTARYGPTKTDIARVANYLEAHGIRVTNVSANRLLIHTEATTAAYEHALDIRINDYKRNGRRFYSTADRPRIPRSLAPLVTNILGLNHGVQLHPHSYFRPPAVTANRATSHRTQAPPVSLTYLSPLQIATAYNVPDLTGESHAEDVGIAIVTALTLNVRSNPYYSAFWNAFGLPDHAINVALVGGSSVNTGGAGETLLDIEYAGAMGPGAELNVYVAANASLVTFTKAYNQVVMDNTSAVMSTSWGLYDNGWGANLIETSEQIFMQAAAQGISMFAAAGDNGAADNGPGLNNADYPSSSVYVTAANGTELTISDISGTYASEVAWNDADSCGLVTGGGISHFIDKPVWQVGPGVPTDVDRRMSSDVALTASCVHPMYVLQDDMWYVASGTSAVAPMLAGIFAIAVARNGDRLGQVNKLLYNDVSAGNYASDFHDVTEGCNGKLPDGSPSCAGPDWDHPTGWGSLNVGNLFKHLGIQGPKGTLSGAVTDAETGAPIAGARIVVTTADDAKYVMRSAEDGSYSRLLPTGDYTAEASGFGYAEGTASVSISDDQTTTRDFALTTAPTATLSGKVSDSSGHGYGLYADIKVSTAGFGQVADVWTDPSTGQYSVELPKGETYTLKIAAAFRGYRTNSKTVTLSGDKTGDVALTVSQACTAPGYHFASGGFSEDFNGGRFPPGGWTVTNPVDGNVVWKLTSQLPADNKNWTGGTGDAASADSAVLNQAAKPYDTSLVTSPVSVSALQGATVLKYRASFAHFLADSLDLGISSDNGNSWTTLLHWTKKHSVYSTGEQVRVNLASYLPSEGTFKLRWRYYNLAGGWNGFAQIDDVVIGSCSPIPGGLVTGQVIDANTDEGVVGASVTDDSENGSRTIVNSADPALPAGTYLFFTADGDRTLTVTAGRYSSATAEVAVEPDHIARQDFVLKAARFKAAPNDLNLHVMAGASTTVSFALGNTGNTAGRFSIFPIDAPPPPTGSDAAPLRRKAVKHPDWINKSLFWIDSHVESGAGQRGHGTSTWSNGLSPNESAWVNLADLPIKVGGNVVAYNSQTGKVYSISGHNNAGSALTSAYVYDLGVDTWRPIANVPTGRAGALGEFIDGKLYLAGGSSPQGGVRATNVYDPASNQWHAAAPILAAVSSAASVVLNGKMYVIGGMRIEQTGTGIPTNLVQVYDPASDTWSLGARYPGIVIGAACGAITGKIYCAGGGAAGARTDGYVYDPASDTWSPIADMPLSGGVHSALYGVSNGKLLLVGGYTSKSTGPGTTLTNQVITYDPTTDSWGTLPNTNHPLARAGGTCGLDGFYIVGSTNSSSPFTFSDNVQKLPGYGCGDGGIPWATVTPDQGNLEPDDSVRVELTVDGAEQEKFTTSKAYLKINGAPESELVPITVHWDSRPVKLMLAGEAAPDHVRQGGNLTYTLTVQNEQAANHGAATGTTLTYSVPDSAQYIISGGDASCTVPAAGSSAAPAGATGGEPGTVSCDLGTLAQGASKTVTIAVKAEKSGTLTSHFDVTAREAGDSSKSALDLTTTVIGSADVGVSLSGATFKKAEQGTMPVTVSNAGPDTATDVKLKLTAKAGLALQGASADQADCSATGSSGYECELGDVAAGESVTVKLSVTGQQIGTASLTAQAMTSADDAGEQNNVATASVTVKANSDGGGGALGWLALAVLLGLTALAREVRRQGGNKFPVG